MCLLHFLHVIQLLIAWSLCQGKKERRQIYTSSGMRNEFWGRAGRGGGVWFKPSTTKIELQPGRGGQRKCWFFKAKFNTTPERYLDLWYTQQDGSSKEINKLQPKKPNGAARWCFKCLFLCFHFEKHSSSPRACWGASGRMLPLTARFKPLTVTGCIGKELQILCLKWLQGGSPNVRLTEVETCWQPGRRTKMPPPQPQFTEKLSSLHSPVCFNRARAGELPCRQCPMLIRRHKAPSGFSTWGQPNLLPSCQRNIPYQCISITK